MDVKEIPTETLKDVDLKIIEEFFYDSMSGFHGRRDLSWIGCLFDNELRDSLNIKKGMIHYFHNTGLDKVESILSKNRVYGYYGNPKAILYTKELPKGFNLFIIGPEYNNKNLEIVCSCPKINARDFEEKKVLEEINSRVETLAIVKGKHENVKGKIELYGSPIDAVILHKTWEMPVEPPFSFREDIKDIQTFAQIYTGFFNYQQKRDKSFKHSAAELVTEVLDKRKTY